MGDNALGGGRTCLDASIIIKLLTREKDSDEAAALFSQLLGKNSEIFEPVFLKVEVYSTLRKKSYLGELSSRKVKTALNFFEKLPLDYVVEDKKMLDESLKLAEQLSMPVIYDCLYLALAKFKQAVFVTADEKFLKKAKMIYQNSLSLSEAVL